MAEIEKNSIFKTKDASGNILIHYFKTRIENLIGGPLGLDKGGTGQSTAAAARNALGLGNTTGALPIANGGTGAASASAARTALGITPANIAAVPTTRKVNGKALSADVTLTAPDVGARAADWLPTLAQVGGVRPNLLDNAHRIINQIGITTRSANGYLPDRWAAWFSANAQGHVDLVAGGWQITKNAGDYITVGQPIEMSVWELLVGKTVTLSALIGDVLYSTTLVVTDAYQSTHLLYGLDLGIGSNSTNGFIQVALFTDTTTDVIKHIKLEFGADQTLAHQDANGNWVLIDPLPNPQQELAKCQRYYQRWQEVRGYTAIHTEYIPVYFNYPEMRAIPQVTVHGAITDGANNTIPGVTAVSAYLDKNSADHVRLSAGYSGDLQFYDVTLDANL